MSKRTKLTVSASQLTTFSDCARKWGYQKVLRLEEPPRTNDPRVFGDILHAVCERFLEADDLGRDERGNPVDLFPRGWTISKPRFGKDDGIIKEVSPAEAAQIQQLIAKAIETRVLRRLPGRRIEKQVTLPVAPKDPERGLISIWLTGFVDVWYRDRIVDHKTSKTKTYLLGPKRLAKSPQMLIYARDCLVEAEKRGEAIPSEIHLRHNQFVKDTTTVRFREATVTREQVETFWSSWVVPQALRMREMLDFTTWDQFPDPDNFNVCNAYGGCPYRSVCFGQETIEAYTARIERLKNRARKALPTSTPKSEPKMSAFRDRMAKLRAEKKASAPEAPAPKPRARADGPPPKPRARPEPAPDPDTPRAPWHNEGCPSCKDSPTLGFSSSGKPCRICVLRTRVQPSGYSIEAEEGQLKVTHLESEEVTLYPWIGKKAEPKTLPPPEVTDVEPECVVDEPPAPVEAPKKKAKKKKAKKTKAAEVEVEVDEGTECSSAPPHTFSLFIHCAPEKGPRVPRVTLAELMLVWGREVAKAAGVESYYQADAFRRRDALAGMVGAMGLKNICVIAHPGTPDEKALVAALEAQASLVVRGSL